MRLINRWRDFLRPRFLPVSVILLTFACQVTLKVTSRAFAGSREPAEFTRHALLVGIDEYQRPPGYDRGAGGYMEGQTPAGLPRRSSFFDLHGAKNDVEAMGAVVKRFGFEDVHFLKDGAATRERILTDFQRYLIDAASPGDVCLFYYSGHGSRVRNSLGDPKGYDESLVPTDSNLGAPDIRDKELARLCLNAIQRHITLTIVADSCFSGTIGRGGNDSRTRGVPWDETDVHEAPSFSVPPEDLGTLIFSACQDYEAAQEYPRDHGWRGTFSYAFQKVLDDPASPNQSAEQVFQRVASLMQSERANQQPVMAGDLSRRKGTLFDSRPVPALRPTANVTRVNNDGNVLLKGGIDLGLGIDTELTGTRMAGGGKPVRLQVKKMEGLAECSAIIMQGRQDEIRPGDQFVLERWGAQPADDLKVWIPPAVKQPELDSLCKQVNAFRETRKSQWADDPTQPLALQLVQHDASGWTVTRSNGGAANIGSVLPSKPLIGSEPIFVRLPPATLLAEKLKVGPGSELPSISSVASQGQADYALEGRLMGTRVEYAWVRPGATREGSRNGTDPLPARSDWFAFSPDSEATSAAAERLLDAAVVLARIHGWLSIQSPGDEFPYKLALREAAKKQIIQGGKVYEGRHYDLLLVPDPGAFRRLAEAHKSVEQRRIYVFSIDSHGNSYLLFNRGGDVENLYPEHPEDIVRPPSEPIVLGRPGMLEMQEPFGLDTYILLASKQNIPNPYVLEFSGVRSKGPSRGESGLSRLVHGLGSGARGPSVADPTDWSIDKMMIRSEPKNSK
jgi:hypothetical protein